MGTNPYKQFADLLEESTTLSGQAADQRHRLAKEQLLLSGEAIGPLGTPSAVPEDDRTWFFPVSNDSPLTSKLQAEDAVTFLQPDRAEKGPAGRIQQTTEKGVIIHFPRKDAEQRALGKTGWYLVEAPFDFNRSLIHKLTEIGRKGRHYPPEPGHSRQEYPRRATSITHPTLDAPSTEALQLALGGNDIAAIQGPPGTGKTHLLKTIAQHFLQRDKRVLLTAFSNQAVENALQVILESLPEFRDIIAKKGRRPENADLRKQLKEIKEPQMETAGPLCVGATFHSLAVLNTLPQFDVVLVDEAGQAPVYGAAVAGAHGSKIVLFGDQEQLAPVNTVADQGIEIDSALGHLIANRPHFIHPLTASHRLCQGICDVIRTHFYPHIPLTPTNQNRNSSVSGAPWEGGIRQISHNFRGGRQSNEDEIAMIQRIIADLLTRQVMVDQGAARAVTPDDIAVLSPYRWQSLQLQKQLVPLGLQPDRIGTVDKMQGSSIPITIYSMTAGHRAEIQEHAEFLFQPNRWNVALSRSKALSIVVGNIDAHADAQTQTTKGLLYQRRIMALLKDIPSSPMPIP